MSVLESFGELRNQVVKADGEIMSVAEKDAPAIQTKLDDTRHEADQQASKLEAVAKSGGDDAQRQWQQIQADWHSHIERMRTQLDNAKTGYDLTVSEAEAESAETDALNAIAFAASAVLEAEQATLQAVLTRRRAEALAASVS
jgi:ElaB/YqjD/DUF883 family membrane-anchored ribosome-binding protein